MFEATINAVSKAYPQNGGVIALLGGKPSEMMEWARKNLPENSSVFLASANANPAHVVRGSTLSGAVIFNEETYANEVLLGSLKCALTTAAMLVEVLPVSLIHCAYDPTAEEPAETDEVTKCRAAMKIAGYESNVSRHDEEGMYFRYDTDDTTTKENGEKFYEINASLREVGYDIPDPQIEHDCISGTVLPIKSSHEEAAAQQPELDAVQILQQELSDVSESCDHWRRLALQFDKHRMEALWWLRRVIASPPLGDISSDTMSKITAFLVAAPQSGNEIRTQLIAELKREMLSSESLREMLSSESLREMAPSYQESVRRVLETAFKNLK